MSNGINLSELIDEWDSDIEFSEDCYYKYYESARKYRNLYEKIKILHECKWCINSPFIAGLTATIENWLMNFKLEEEQKTALKLLPKILFYSKKEMKALCRATFNELIKLVEIKLRCSVDDSFIKNHFIFIPLTESDAEWCTELRHFYRLG